MAYEIQILGLRDRITEGKTTKAEVFHNRMWRVQTEETIFQDPNSILAKVPTNEQFNLYWTVARCFPERGRKLAEQFVIPWDIDHVGGDTQEETEARAKRVAELALGALGVPYDSAAVVCSGYGVQFFIKMINPILSDDYFDSVREHYKVLCDKIQAKLNYEGVQGTVDSSVFSRGRLMRLPNTINRKPGRADRYARVLQSKLVPMVFDIMEKSGIAEFKKPDQIHPDVIKKYPKPDTKAVLAGCPFIQYCFTNQEKVVEPQWYAAISIVARLENGHKLAHEMSEKHPGYSEHETDLKIEQSLKNAGPRTCKDIASRFDGCRNCPHYGSDLSSPILICGPDYIKSETTGFREIATDKDGNPKPGKVAYDDLIKKFGKEFPFMSVADMRVVFTFNGRYWEEMLDLQIKNWMVKLVKPSASSAEMDEFVNRLKAMNVRPFDWFSQSILRKMNFKNGVLDLDTMVLGLHSPEYGFTFALGYDYDPRAASPVWDKFMQDISEGDEKTKNLLEEFAGYAIAGGECLAQKALVLYGEGANGKSVFAETIEAVLGMQNTSHLMVHHLKNDQMRAQLFNKPYNYSDETLEYAFKNPGELKSLITGGTTTAKVVYKATFPFRNKAKFIILTNNLPETNDSSDGLHRRLIIIECRAKFKGSADNKMLRKQMWENELPGICNRFIEGYKRLIAREYNFDIPEYALGLAQDYARDNNSVLRFFEECIERTNDEESRALSNEIYAEYQSWLMVQNEKPMPAVKFTREFRKVGNLPPAEPIRLDGKLLRGWKKITLKKGDF